MQIAIYTPFK